MYIPVESTNSFVYAGPFMGGTIITANDIVQDTWNADTKLDKITASGAYRFYGVNASGNEWTPTLRQIPQTTNASYKYQPVMYDITDGAYTNNGLIRIAEVPLERYHTASKAYVDNLFKVYQHNMSVYVEYYGDYANIRFTLYDGGANAKGYAKTFGTMAVSGCATIGGSIYPMLYANIDTTNSSVSITYLTDNGEETTIMDAGTWTINDTVTRII